MKFASILTATAVVALCFIPTAHADDDFSVSFNYNSSAPIEETYESFERTAEDACQIKNFRRVGGPLRKFKLERICKADLMDKIVTATRSQTLMAFHRGETFQAEESTVLAGS